MTRLKKLLIAATVFASTAVPAFADAVTEAYVMENANRALAALNNPELDRLSRRAEFNALMQEFTDMDLIAMRAIGKYYRRFSEEEKAAYTEAFAEYALATYEGELDKFRGTGIVVTGSDDKEPNRNTKVDSVVTSIIELPNAGSGLQVLWRVVEFQPDSQYAEVFGNGFKVTDVALDLDGGRVWLGQNQREQFLALLDQTNGSSEALIAKINEMTERLFARASATLETEESEANVKAG